MEKRLMNQVTWGTTLQVFGVFQPDLLPADEAAREN